MSVINEMLKDLEGQKKCLTYDHHLAPNAMPPPVVPPPTPKKFMSPYFIIIILLLILGAILVNNYFSAQLKAKQVPFYLKQHKVAINANQFFKLTQFTVQGDAKTTQIHLQFNFPLNYQIHSTDNTLEIEVKNIKVLPPIPSIDKTLVSKIQLEPKPSGLTLKFTLADNAQVAAFPDSGQVTSIDLTIRYHEPVIDKELIDPQQHLAELAYQKALIALNNGQEDVAVAEFKNALAQNNNYFPAQLALIKLLIKQNKLDSSQRYLWAALAAHSDEPSLLLLQAIVWSQQGKYLQAEKLLNAYKPPFEKNLTYYATQAYIESKLGNTNLAIQLYEQVLAVNPYNGNWWLGLAIALQKNKQTQTAVSAYQRALQTTNIDPSVRAYIMTQLQALQ